MNVGDKEILEQLFSGGIGAISPAENAILNDKKLFTLAEYLTSKGYMITGYDIKDIHSKFAYLKTLVMNGSFTIDQLETDVYNKYGIQNANREKTYDVIGFSLDNIQVADIPYDSKENR